MSADEMISLVAHEIRNHLAVIQGFGNELVVNWDRLPEDTKRVSVRRMTERARYLNVVIGNLMSLRRIETGHGWQGAAPVDVRQVIEKLGQELEELAGGMPLQLSAPGDLSPVVADPQRIRQILTNLVLNAARFSPSSSPIVLGATQRDSTIRIEVRDHGPGIPDERRSRLFQKFTRLEPGGGGMGLGLFISRELARSMGGDLWIEDPSEGSGCLFVCSLPVAA